MTEASAFDILPNLRDLGGLPAAHGTTRAGVLYRSAAPLPGDRAPVDTVPVWPCRTVIDLRAPLESDVPHPLVEDGATVYRAPFFDDGVWLLMNDGTGAPQFRSLDAIYRALLTEAAAQIVRVFELAATAEPPLLIHCAAGKDRTGIAIALLLATAGVEREAIVADYVETGQHMPAVGARLPHVAAAYDFDTIPDGELFTAPASAISQVLDSWSSHDGGVCGWLRAQGADPELIDQWAARILDDGLSSGR